MMDVVYTLRNANWNPELKFSLRSLRNIPHGKVFTAGHTPMWAVNVHPIPVEQGAERFINTTKILIEACKDPNVSDEFIYMNDDFYIMKPITEIPVMHRGPLKPLVDTEHGGAYRQQRKQAYDYLLSKGIKDPLNYDLHIPMVFNKHKLLEILMDMKIGHSHKRSIYGNIVGIGGDYMDDVKIHGSDDFNKESVFLSSNKDAVDRGKLGKYLKVLFKEKSEYEA